MQGSKNSTEEKEASAGIRYARSSSGRGLSIHGGSPLSLSLHSTASKYALQVLVSVLHEVFEDVGAEGHYHGHVLGIAAVSLLGVGQGKRHSVNALVPADCHPCAHRHERKSCKGDARALKNKSRQHTSFRSNGNWYQEGKAVHEVVTLALLLIIVVVKAIALTGGIWQQYFE